MEDSLPRPEEDVPRQLDAAKGRTSADVPERTARNKEGHSGCEVESAPYEDWKDARLHNHQQRAKGETGAADRGGPAREGRPKEKTDTPGWAGVNAAMSENADPGERSGRRQAQRGEERKRQLPPLRRDEGEKKAPPSPEARTAGGGRIPKAREDS